MNSLSRHIEYLLLEHNCVVVPQFGAFVTRENTAVRAENENLFFPPSRVVRFNQDIVEDDGLLVGVIQGLLRCRTADAKRQVQEMVLNLRQQLLADGQVDFGTIGVFTQDEDGHVSFEPCQAGAVTPKFYGLDSFLMPKLTHLQRQERMAARKKKAILVEESNEKHIVIRLNRRSLRYAALSAAAILICILLITPVHFFPTRSSNEASVVPATATEIAAPEPKVENPSPMVVSNKVEVEEKVTEEKAVPATEVPQQVVEPQEEYAIVLASNVGRKNAESYVEDLKARGYKNVRIHDNGKMLRVILTGYQTESEAYKKNGELHNAGKEFAYSWVMKL